MPRHYKYIFIETLHFDNLLRHSKNTVIDYMSTTFVMRALFCNVLYRKVKLGCLRTIFHPAINMNRIH